MSGDPFRRVDRRAAAWVEFVLERKLSVADRACAGRFTVKIAIVRNAGKNVKNLDLMALAVCLCQKTVQFPGRNFIQTGDGTRTVLPTGVSFPVRSSIRKTTMSSDA